jgi:hypothetical protein
VHVNLVGPMPAKSVGGREYKYIAVDNYSHARLMRLKSEAADIFMTLKAAEEKNLEGRCMR